MRRTTIVRPLALLGTTAASLLVAGPAAAGEFTINACQADSGNFSTRAFEDFATRGMRWKRACDPEGPGLRGLVTSNVVRRDPVARGSEARVSLNAPEGTRFARLRWSGQARRSDCRYTMQVYAVGPGVTVPIKNVRANSRCPRPGRVQAAGWPGAQTFNVAGATRIVQRVVCVGGRGRGCSGRGLNYIRTFKAQATVIDESAPTVGILQDTPLARGDWVKGTQPLNYNASDNAGVKLARAMAGGTEAGTDLRACDFAQRVPCPNGLGRVNFNTDRLPEGTQALAVQAIDAADNPNVSLPITARIDRTAPGAVAVGVEGGETWRSSNDFDLSWQNPQEGDRAPITAAHFKLCRPDGSDCVSGDRSGPSIGSLTDLAVPAPGEWRARVWREDQAANTEPGNASLPVALRYDPERPELGFEPSPTADPTMVSVLVTDRVSGLAGGQIEISRQGSGSWQALPTQREGSRLVARIDDSSLPAGAYALRASASDQAQNQNTTDRRLDGQPMVVNLPLRIQTRMQAGVATKRTGRRAGTRRGQRRSVTVLRPSARAHFGRRVRIDGRLTNSDGQPIAGASIDVGSRTPTSAERLVAVLRTDSGGRYSYVAPASSTRTLRFAYHGTALILPAQDEVGLLVPAPSTIRVGRRQVLNGQPVSFRGRLRALPVPAPGKLVELQVRLSGGWQTFRTTRTDASGRWGVRYRFKRSCGLQRFGFRARLPKETGYPFEAGGSRPVTVRVRGRACR